MLDGTLKTTQSEDISVKSPSVQTLWSRSCAAQRPYGIVQGSVSERKMETRGC